MLIKFKETDPRAGLVARMDSIRGRELVDIGAAEQVTEAEAASTSAAKAEEAAPAPAPAPAPAAPAKTTRAKK